MIISRIWTAGKQISSRPKIYVVIGIANSPFSILLSQDEQYLFAFMEKWAHKTFNLL